MNALVLLLLNFKCFWDASGTDVMWLRSAEFNLKGREGGGLLGPRKVTLNILYLWIQTHGYGFRVTSIKVIFHIIIMFSFGWESHSMKHPNLQDVRCN